MFDLNNEKNLDLLEIATQVALSQVGAARPQNVDALFDFVKRIPKWFLYQGVGAFKAAQDHIGLTTSEYSQSMFAVKHYGAIAPFLDQGQMQAYLEFVGLGRIIEECSYIYCQGLPMGQTATVRVATWRNMNPDDWVTPENGVVMVERTLRRLNDPLMLPPAPTDRISEPIRDKVKPPLETRSPVGSATRFSAIPVESSAIDVDHLVREVESSDRVPTPQAFTKDSKKWDVEVDRWFVGFKSIVSMQPNGHTGFELKIARLLWVNSISYPEQCFNWGVQSLAGRPGCFMESGYFFFPKPVVEAVEKDELGEFDEPNDELEHTGVQEVMRSLTSIEVESEPTLKAVDLPLEVEIKSKLKALGAVDPKTFCDRFGDRRLEALAEIEKLHSQGLLVVTGKNALDKNRSIKLKEFASVIP